MSTAPLSQIDPFLFEGRLFHVKRDDLIDPLLSGNKYRKLYTLLHSPAGQYRKLISYGGIQSNAMLSIAALSHQKGWRFEYTAKTVPARLKANPTGNLKMALELGMRPVEVSPDQYEKAIQVLKAQHDTSTLFVPQGGADPVARHGVRVLAEEITHWNREQQIEKVTLVTPSGTGTTAYYLAEALPELKVVTTPVVGDKNYLIEQMRLLGSVPKNLQVIEGESRFAFAKPVPELLMIWRALKKAGIEFDLIYGARMWHVLMQHLDLFSGNILYLHSGGLIGNPTMLDRYRHKGMA